jgi:hypothetical protein
MKYWIVMRNDCTDLGGTVHRRKEDAFEKSQANTDTGYTVLEYVTQYTNGKSP